MRRGRGIFRLTPLRAALAHILVAVFFSAGMGLAWAGAPTTDGAPSPTGSEAGSAKKKARRSSGKKSTPKAKASPDTKVTRAKSTRPAKQKAASMINEDVRLTPFPSHASAAKKALSQNRRDQLDDAEKAARSADQSDRWQTVLFHLRNLDARSDSEGCFWRLVAYYRLGQVDRARTLRQSCDLAPKDAAVIEAEDEQASQLQPPTQPSTTVAEKDQPAPVGNPAPYAGTAPAKADR
ncbi:MAG TPA: hypothetical protein VH853_09120 [Polyangia bacterium]|jgi:hypothetical protein|nr:hypothetical protein [Polyangia bacterium]